MVVNVISIYVNPPVR